MAVTGTPSMDAGTMAGPAPARVSTYLIILMEAVLPVPEMV